MRVHTMGDVAGEPAFDGHEQVLSIEDETCGLNAIISIHDTRLGPGLGGCRMWAYESDKAALHDALRLSRAMTCKNALAGLSLGGGKSVIIGDSRTDKTPALLLAFARALDSLEGRYLTAEDVGIGVADIELMRTVTPHVRGIPEGGVGDPSPHTAYGVFCGIKATAAKALGSDDLSGVGVAVQGLGNVGMTLACHVHEAGARLVVADIRQDAIDCAVSQFGAEVIAPERAHAAEVEIFSPCALGAVLNARTIPEIRAKAIAGSANNQLETGDDGERLMQRGIHYAPDYAINAGGVISIGHEGPDFDPAALKADLERIGATLAQIFKRSAKTGTTTVEIAKALAMERLNSVARPLEPAAASSV